MASKKSGTYLGVITGSVLALAASMPAQAAIFTAQDAVNDGCVGQTSCTVNGFFTLTADPGKQITGKTVGGVIGLGVATDATNPKTDQSEGEIDIDEALNVTFKEATILESLDLSFLYQPGVYADEVFEVALVTPLGAALGGTLTVSGDNTATLGGVFASNGATYQNLSPSVTGSGGSYRINNPFAKQLITGFSLKPQLNGTATSYRNSDFALSGVRTVPEPGMVAALFGVGTLVSLKLRRKANLV